MHGQSTRGSTSLRSARWGAVLAAAAALGVSLASAAELPSLDEIKAHWKRQREKIQSLYIETTGETTSPLSLEELRTLPGFERRSWYSRFESQFAFKGDKRYNRSKLFGIPEPAPVPKLRPDATPMEKAMREYRLEQKKKREAREASEPAQPRLVRQDEMRGYNGRAVWFRLVTELKHPDGRLEKTSPVVTIRYPRRLSRLISSTTYLNQIGLAVVAPDTTDMDAHSKAMAFRKALPDLFDLAPYTMEEKTEEVDGARCVVLSGTLETTFTFRNVSQKYTTRDKLWLDLERGLALRKREQTTSPSRAKTLGRIVNSSFEEVAPGIWLPRDSEQQSIAPADDPDYPEQYRGKPILSTRVKLTKWIINEVPDTVFEPYIKPGDHVQDDRETGRGAEKR